MYLKVQGGLENETVKALGPEKETVKVLAFEKETLRMTLWGLGKETGKVDDHEEEEPVKVQALQNPTLRGCTHCYIVKLHDLRILTVQESPQQH